MRTTSGGPNCVYTAARIGECTNQPMFETPCEPQRKSLSGVASYTVTVGVVACDYRPRRRAC